MKSNGPNAQFGSRSRLLTGTAGLLVLASFLCILMLSGRPSSQVISARLVPQRTAIDLQNGFWFVEDGASVSTGTVLGSLLKPDQHTSLHDWSERLEQGQILDVKLREVCQTWGLEEYLPPVEASSQERTNPATEGQLITLADLRSLRDSIAQTRFLYAQRGDKPLSELLVQQERRLTQLQHKWQVMQVATEQDVPETRELPPPARLKLRLEMQQIIAEGQVIAVEDGWVQQITPSRGYLVSDRYLLAGHSAEHDVTACSDSLDIVMNERLIRTPVQIVSDNVLRLPGIERPGLTDTLDIQWRCLPRAGDADYSWEELYPWIVGSRGE